MTSFIARFSEFKNEDVIYEGENAIDLTDVTKGGIVELAFDVTPKCERVYLRFALHDLVRLAMDQRTDDE